MLAATITVGVIAVAAAACAPPRRAPAHQMMAGMPWSTGTLLRSTPTASKRDSTWSAPSSTRAAVDAKLTRMGGTLQGGACGSSVHRTDRRDGVMSELEDGDWHAVLGVSRDPLPYPLAETTPTP
jgi:hypothetical protein